LQLASRLKFVAYHILQGDTLITCAVSAQYAVEYMYTVMTVLSNCQGTCITFNRIKESKRLQF